MHSHCANCLIQSRIMSQKGGEIPKRTRWMHLTATGLSLSFPNPVDSCWSLSFPWQLLVPYTFEKNKISCLITGHMLVTLLLVSKIQTWLLEAEVMAMNARLFRKPAWPGFCSLFEQEWHRFSGSFPFPYLRNRKFSSFPSQRGIQTETFHENAVYSVESYHRG